MILSVPACLFLTFVRIASGLSVCGDSGEYLIETQIDHTSSHTGEVVAESFMIEGNNVIILSIRHASPLTHCVLLCCVVLCHVVSCFVAFKAVLCLFEKKIRDASLPWLQVTINRTAAQCSG